MDDLMTSLFNYIPAKWQPYVATLLLALYVVTKVRRHLTAAKLQQATQAVMSTGITGQTAGQNVIPKNLITFVKPAGILTNMLRILC